MQYASGNTNPTPVARSGKEIFPLRALSEVSLPSGQTTMLTANTMKFVFTFSADAAESQSVVQSSGVRHEKLSGEDTSNCGGCLELSVSPVVVDCGRLKAVITEIKRKFAC